MIAENSHSERNELSKVMMFIAELYVAGDVASDDNFVTYLRAAKYLSPETFFKFSKIVKPKLEAINHSTLIYSSDRITTEALDEIAYEKLRNLLKDMKKDIRDLTVFAETAMNGNAFH